MPAKRKLRGISTETQHSDVDDEEDYNSETDDPGSLAGFIDNNEYYDDEDIYRDTDLLRSSSDEDDDDYVEEQVQPPKRRGRPPKQTTPKKSTNGTTVAVSPAAAPPLAAKKARKSKFDLTLKSPGDSTYPVNDFSLTITKTKDDVGLDSLDSIAQFIESHCLKGAVSTEVGQRVFQLHLQGVFRLHWPTYKEHVQHLQKILKSLLPNNGTLYKVLVKPFKTGQVFSAMIGYVTKDQGQAHYQIRTHHVSRQELSFGRRDHDALLTSYDDSKKVLNLKNIFNEAYKFNMRCMHPAVVPIHVAIHYMIQSGSYILSSDFISTFKKIDLNEARILWEMVHQPLNVALEDIMQLLFDSRSYGLKVSKRYFVAGVHRLETEEVERISAPTVTFGESSSSSDSSPHSSRISRMLDITRSSSAHQTSSSSRTPVTTQPDYIPLGASDPELFTLDRSGEHGVSQSEFAGELSNECPAHIDDMLAIVRNLRQRRRDNMSASGELATLATNSNNNRGRSVNDFSDDEEEEGDDHSEHPIVTDSRERPKSRSGNMSFTNLNDYMDFE